MGYRKGTFLQGWPEPLRAVAAFYVVVLGLLAAALVVALVVFFLLMACAGVLEMLGLPQPWIEFE